MLNREETTRKFAIKDDTNNVLWKIQPENRYSALTIWTRLIMC